MEKADDFCRSRPGQQKKRGQDKPPLNFKNPGYFLRYNLGNFSTLNVIPKLRVPPFSTECPDSLFGGAIHSYEGDLRAVRGSQFLADDWRLKQTMKEITRCNSESNFPESPLSSISGRLMCSVKSTRDEGLSTDCGAQSMIGKFRSYTSP
ncbi:hypothetical protein TNCT_157561 [Trichonephila clavata]|uniref:Uncharacterized protein n=1 Tax=Trichonephila clavata TaxID=2740835 RepID=A0A8X6I504_TRICU|nr:hypothetical protein TNCT_157561 [Trichonephila clavata]